MVTGVVTDAVQARFQLLGPVRAWGRAAGSQATEQEIDLGPGKQRAVLAVLLLDAGSAVPTSRILDAVWGDERPANGLNVVQKYVAGLRRALEPARSPREQSQVLTLTDGGYLLAVDPRAVDADLFDATVTAAVAALRAAQPDDAASLARDALGLWHGEPLAGLPGPWFAAQRSRLLDGRGLVLETWATAELELGHHQRTAPELRRHVDEFPLRERLRELLMLALYRSGRRAEALAVFRDTREYLVDEVGAEPGAGLQDLFGRMLRSDPALDPPPTPAPPPPTTPDVAPPPAAAPPAPPASPGGWTPPAAEPGAPPATPVPAAYRPPEPGAPPLPGTSPPSPATQPAEPPRTSRWRTVGRQLGAAVAILGPIASIGMLTWAFVGFFAIRRRSVALGVLSVVYLGLTITLLILAGPDEQVDLPLWRDWALGVLFLLTMGGGAVHLAAIVHTRRATRPRRPDWPTG
jgi:DNA-binding SARP family transcriptional activator